MSSGAELKESFLSSYDHRTPSELETDIDPVRILEGYLNSHGVEDYSHIESDFPYHAVLGRLSDTPGEALSMIHFDYWNGEELAPKGLGQISRSDKLGDHIESMLPENDVLYTAGVIPEENMTLNTPTGLSLKPESVHCMVFYQEPDVEPVDLRARMDFESLNHKKSAMDAVKGRKIGTAIIHSGEEISGAQVDYWTRSLDQQTGDYGEIEWGDPDDLE